MAEVATLARPYANAAFDLAQQRDRLSEWSRMLSFLSAAVATPTEQRPTVVWLHGTSCTGCSCGFLDIDYVPVVDILTKFINMAYHPDVSLATGAQVTGEVHDVQRPAHERRSPSARNSSRSCRPALMPMQF